MRDVRKTAGNAFSAISHCDEGLAQVNEKKDDLEADFCAMSTVLDGKIGVVQAKLGAVAQSQLEKDNMQADERKTFTKYKEDLEQDVSGVPKVLERIRNFPRTLFVQKRDVVTVKTDRSWVVQTSSRVMCDGCERSVSSFSGCLLSDSGESRFKHPVGMNRLCLTLTGVERWESHESNKSRQLRKTAVHKKRIAESGHSSCSAKGDGRNV